MQYPTLQLNITSTASNLPVDKLMTAYDKYTNLGLLLLPKDKFLKTPLAKYWRKDSEMPSREQVLADQTTLQSGWCIVTGERSGRLVVIDLDTNEIKKGGNDPQKALDEILALSPSSFAFITPSGGIHLFYRQPEHQALLTNAKTPLQGVDKRGEGGQVASYGSFYRYTGENAKNKGVMDGHGGFYEPTGEHETIPLMSDELYNWLLTTEKKHQGEAFGRSTVGKERIKKHFAQPSSEQERITLSALQSILHQWGVKDYEEWLQMWMSAHHASNGSFVVRDFILAHEDVIWKSFTNRTDGGQGHFIDSWAGHEYRDGGYTAASLFWLARQAGWMSRTGYELDPRLAEKINVRYVGHWLALLDEIPKRLMLMSQTGSGKTFSVKFLYEKLGHPKTVIFVPSIKLALELTNTLVNRHDLPAVCYYDQDSRSSIEVQEMVSAPILVTTLQTFATKVKLPMENYGLVYIEESDQLISSFARGGGGRYGSHVSDREARQGVATLRQAFLKSEYVWCVDATMSRVTYDATNIMSDIPPKLVINEWVEPKAPVIMVDTVGRALQEVLRALGLGQSVVAVCDTAKQASEVRDVMDMLGALKNKRSLVVTRDTETDQDVHAFMEDVNGQAPRYDLLCYNSVMASGVSITDFSPDVVVQFCSYLTPRVNLQLLNRYRNQKVVYCYYRMSENLYSQSDKAILELAQSQVRVEGRLINMPVAQRNDDALLRDRLGAISAADTDIQNRSPRDFYMALLKSDGRTVSNADETPVSELINTARTSVNEFRKAYLDQLKISWNETPPINRDNPAPRHYTDLQIAQGEIHDEISHALRGNIPSGIEPRKVYDLAHYFKDFAIPLTAIIHQEWAIQKAEEYLADTGKAMMTISNNITLVKVVALVKTFYGSFDKMITDSDIAKRAPNFLMQLAHNADNYDKVITRKPQQYEAVMSKDMTNEEKALAYAKIILARVGLKQRAVRISQAGGKAIYGYEVGNYDEAVEFLSWRNPELIVDLNFNTRVIDDKFVSRKDLTIENSDATIQVMQDERVSLENAIKVINQGEKF